MATQRKHWFNVTEALCRSALSGEELGCIVRLMSHMNMIRARDNLDAEKACQVVIKPGELADITDKRQPRAARVLLARSARAASTLAECGSIAVSDLGECVLVDWRNLANLQGWVARTSGESRANSGRKLPSPTPTPTPYLKEETRGAEGAPPSSSAAQFPLAFDPPKRKPEKPPEQKPKPPKPGHQAIKAFCEEYKTARGVSPTVAPKDKPRLGEAFADMGEDLFRSSLRIFFKLEDEWIRQNSYSPGCFLARLVQCSVRAQNYAKQEARRAAENARPARSPQEDEELRSKVTLLFANGGRL